MGALFGILLLLGVTVLTSLGSTSRYAELPGQLADAPAAVAIGFVGVLAGLMFKAGGGVPAHFWVPDAAQGSGSAAAACLTTIPKIGALIALYRPVTAMPSTHWTAVSSGSR